MKQTPIALAKKEEKALKRLDSPKLFCKEGGHTFFHDNKKKKHKTAVNLFFHWCNLVPPEEGCLCFYFKNKQKNSLDQ